VRHSIPTSVVLFSLLLLAVLFVSAAHAQINGVPSSVTSPGLGGRPINGPPSSVTSLGPRGYSSHSRDSFSASNLPRNNVPHDNVPRNGDVRRHRHHYVPYLPPVGYAIPVPYAVDIGAADDDSDNGPDDSDSNYQGGPTIFDRRGYGERSYIPPVPHATESRASQDADLPARPDPPQEPTRLIFKDGRKLEVGNYAIVGATLFDLTPGHARRIALADLDLEATRQENDDHGVVFQLPPTSQAN
jgi:hypothetical protein